jgi:hypothetical protein
LQTVNWVVSLPQAGVCRRSNDKEADLPAPVRSGTDSPQSSDHSARASARRWNSTFQIRHIEADLLAALFHYSRDRRRAAPMRSSRPQHAFERNKPLNAPTLELHQRQLSPSSHVNAALPLAANCGP